MIQAEEDFGGNIGETVADSTPHWIPRPTPASGAPNVVLVILDDAGWSDLGCFGSSVRTPNIDALAHDGLRFSNFHVTPLCSPTRASVLTGRNHHGVGMRFLADADTGFPNSRGRVSRDVPMLPEVLRREGYGTYLVGKWHLAPLHELTPAGPFDNWPLARGFDRFYGFLDGCTDQYMPELFEDNHQVEPPGVDGYHLSTDLAEHAMSFISNHVAFRPESPFFLQIALGATHAPFQVDRSYIEPYTQTFADGWDVEREKRLERQKRLGVMPEHATLSERDVNVPAWSEVDDDARRLYCHLQAAFAGFLEHADEQLGRVLTRLQELGLSDNTMVVVMSDNGASREGGPDGAVDCNAPYSGRPQSVAEQLTKLDLIGTREGPAHYPEGWAMAGNTPFRKYKQYVDLGGVRSPLIVSWPKAVEGSGEVRNQFVHAIDIMPTLLEAAGIAGPEMDGRSFGQSLARADAADARRTQYWEMLGHRAMWSDGWKAVTEHVPGTPYDQDRWRVYDTESDPSESHDIAAERPDLVAQLEKAWWTEAEEFGVLPLDDRSLVQLLGLRSPFGQTTRRTVTLPNGIGHIPFPTGLTGSERSMQIDARLKNRSPENEGVLYASGSAGGGYTLFVRDNKLIFEHSAFGVVDRCEGLMPATAGDCTVGVRLDRGSDRASVASLLVDGREISSVNIGYTSAHLSFWGADVGKDPVSQVSTDYGDEFAFDRDVLHSVTLTYNDRPPIAEIAEALEHIE